MFCQSFCLVCIMITAARVTDHFGLYCLQYEKVLLLWLLAGCSFRELLCMLCIPAEPFPIWNTPFFTYDFMLVQFFFSSLDVCIIY